MSSIAEIINSEINSGVKLLYRNNTVIIQLKSALCPQILQLLNLDLGKNSTDPPSGDLNDISLPKYPHMVSRSYTNRLENSMVE